MDLNSLGMDFTIEEEYFEEKDFISDLPDDVIVIILSKLSWEDVNTIKLISKRFYDIIHRNYYSLERKKLRWLTIEYDEMDSYPLSLDMVLKSARDWRLRDNERDIRKTTAFQSVEKLSGFLKMFDMRDLYEFNIYVAGNIDIFAILEEVFQIETKICGLLIPKIEEKYFRSFRAFIEKLSVESIIIKHICPPSTGPDDVFSLLSSTSFKNIEILEICGCDRIKILPTDFFTNFIRINPTLRDLMVESTNIEFLESAFKEFFAMNQPHKIESGCRYNKVNLLLYFDGEIEHLHNILSINLSKFKNVAEVDISRHLGFPKFESHEDCKNCLNNRHTITKSAYLYYSVGFYRESYH